MKREFLTQYCTCSACEAMCENTPCWGTPEEIKAIIDAGHGHRLMLDYRENPSVGLEYILILTPAVDGRQGRNSPFFPKGRCAFFNSKRRCDLHAAGLKPLEGRVAIHNSLDKKSPDDDDELYPINKGDSLRDHIARLWQVPWAREMVAKWREEHGL